LVWVGKESTFIEQFGLGVDEKRLGAKGAIHKSFQPLPELNIDLHDGLLLADDEESSGQVGVQRTIFIFLHNQKHTPRFAAYHSMYLF
jgi:hypothetical protein